MTTAAALRDDLTQTLRDTLAAVATLTERIWNEVIIPTQDELDGADPDHYVTERTADWLTGLQELNEQLAETIMDLAEYPRHPGATR